MKKAKIMLTAVAVFAIVGGSLAMKARTNVFVYQKTTTIGGAETCPSIAGKYDPNSTGTLLNNVLATPVYQGVAVDPSLCTASIRAIKE